MAIYVYISGDDILRNSCRRVRDLVVGRIIYGI